MLLLFLAMFNYFLSWSKCGHSCTRIDYIC